MPTSDIQGKIEFHRAANVFSLLDSGIISVFIITAGRVRLAVTGNVSVDSTY